MVQAGDLRTKISPPSACCIAWSTRPTDWSSVMRKRVISGTVSVSGSSFSICRLNSGMTEPRLPITLP